MGNFLKTLMKQAAIDAEEQAELISWEDARVVSSESESFGLGQEIWWKPKLATDELGPGTILFRKIDYTLLHKPTVNQRPQRKEDLPCSFYGQMVSKVLVEFQGMECLIIPSTITRRGAHSPDPLLGTSENTENLVFCECEIPTVGPEVGLCECICGKPLELCICCICGAIVKIPVADPLSDDGFVVPGPRTSYDRIKL